MQSDGKIVSVGTAAVGNVGYEFAVARTNENGSPDITFGIYRNGRETIPDLLSSSATNDIGYAVAIQPLDQKIIIAGSSDQSFALLRLMPNGTVDATFGKGGEVTVPFGGSAEAFAVALQMNGDIVVAGEAQSTSSSVLAVARLTKSGTLDTTFGPKHNGEETPSFGASSPDAGRGIVLQTDGKIVLAGSAVVRLNPDGSPDTTFGSAGLTLPRSGLAYAGDWTAVGLQNGTKIVVAGIGGGFLVARIDQYGARLTPRSVQRAITRS